MQTPIATIYVDGLRGTIANPISYRWVHVYLQYYIIILCLTYSYYYSLLPVNVQLVTLYPSFNTYFK